MYGYTIGTTHYNIGCEPENEERKFRMLYMEVKVFFSHFLLFFFLIYISALVSNIKNGIPENGILKIEIKKKEKFN